MAKKPTSIQKPAPLTEEEKRDRFIRFYQQKKNSIAEGILFNMFQGAARGETVMGAGMAVRLANETAEEFMRVVYKMSLNIIDDLAKEAEE